MSHFFIYKHVYTVFVLYSHFHNICLSLGFMNTKWVHRKAILVYLYYISYYSLFLKFLNQHNSLIKISCMALECINYYSISLLCTEHG
jgi:hypothetical protein